MELHSKWDRLSSPTSHWLLTQSDLFEIGMPLFQASTYLANLGCPIYQPFLDYFLRYAGMSLRYRSGPQHDDMAFFRIEDGATVVWSEARQEWQLVFGGDSSHVRMLMRPDGSILSASRNQYSTAIASSIEMLLEDIAAQNLALEADRTFDYVVSSRADGAARIASILELELRTDISDQFVQWWMKGDVGVGVRPCGAIYCPIKHRFNVTAYWPKSDLLLDKQITEALTDLQEPDWGAYRTCEGFRAYRALGDNASLDQRPVPSPRVTCATSFRFAARKGLFDLYQAHQIDEPPPSEETAFQVFLLENHANYKQSGNKTACYYASVGLVAFGHPEFFEDVLDHLPLGTGTGWGDPLWAGLYLGLLLPRFYICPLEATERVRDWVRSHLGRLYWEEDFGTYEVTGNKRMSF